MDDDKFYTRLNVNTNLILIMTVCYNAEIPFSINFHAPELEITIDGQTTGMNVRDYHDIKNVVDLALRLLPDDKFL